MTRRRVHPATGRAGPLPRLATLAALLAACAVANPTVNSLEQAQKLVGEGGYAAVARMAVSCAPRDAGCSQLHRLKADSCRRLADGRGADEAARRDDLDCAAAHYEAALAAGTARPDPQAAPAAVTLELLEATASRRDLATGRAEALRRNAQLRDQAQAAQRLAGARPAGLVFGADAELSAVLLGSEQGGCDGIARAAALLGQAQVQGPPLEPRVRSLDRALANARRARGCAA